MREASKLEQLQAISANRSKDIEMGETSTPGKVIGKNKEKEIVLAEPSKLVNRIDNLDLDKEDFYVALEAPLQIFIIPTYIRGRKTAAYDPKMVSIGPYHYGKPALESMQSHKERALIQFLGRSPKNKTIKPYIKALKKVVVELRKCYEQVDEIKENWKNDDDFVKLMLLDGVFLFEFLSVLRGKKEDHGYADIDPIFGNRGHNLNYNHVMEDLLMMENQIPYLVLFTLVTVYKDHDNAETAVKSLSSLMLAPPGCIGHHFLDMYMKGMLGDHQPNGGQVTAKVSASKLSLLGIKFRKVATHGEIQFERRTKTLSLPSIVINQHTQSLFFNSKAYELRSGTNRALNSYIHLVDFLIQSTDDVSLLRSQGIIVSSLAKDAEVVEVMKELTKDTVPRDVDANSTRIVKEVIQYYEDKEGTISALRIWVANNWAKLLFAGFILYALTTAQVVYSALSYHSGNKKAASPL
ncbi:hypothetical protein MKX03_021363 [Papaver bracteatum]|nr:hypothetical protein MKX03_021363 [Papaver bracteatum]